MEAEGNRLLLLLDVGHRRRCHSCLRPGRIWRYLQARKVFILGLSKPRISEVDAKWTPLTTSLFL